MTKKLNITYKVNGKPDMQKVADALIDLYENHKRQERQTQKQAG